MSLATPSVFVTDKDDGSADFTISVDDENYKFSASTEGDTAIVSYEETLSWRGEIRVSEPREEIFKSLIQSEQMTEYIEKHNLKTVRRERNHD